MMHIGVLPSMQELMDTFDIDYTTAEGIWLHLRECDDPRAGMHWAVGQLGGYGINALCSATDEPYALYIELPGGGKTIVWSIQEGCYYIEDPAVFVEE